MFMVTSISPIKISALILALAMAFNASARRIHTDTLRARDGDGISIQDDGGNHGIFIDDGGGLTMGAIITDSPFRVEAASAAPALLQMFADDGEDNADKWRWQVADEGVSTLESGIGGSFVAQLTLTPNADVTISTTAIEGNATVAGNLSMLTGKTAVIEDIQAVDNDGLTFSDNGGTPYIKLNDGGDVNMIGDVKIGGSAGDNPASRLDISGANGTGAWTAVTIKNDDGNDPAVSTHTSRLEFNMIKRNTGNAENAGHIVVGKDGAYGIASNSDSYMGFATANGGSDTERFRIDSDGDGVFTGDVKIGGSVGDTPASALEVSGFTTIGGNDALKVYAYSSTLSAGDIAANYHDFTITSVTASKVMSMSTCGYDAGSGHVYCLTDVAVGFETYARLTSSTNCRVYFDGSDYSSTSDRVSVTITVID